MNGQSNLLDKVAVRHSGQQSDLDASDGVTVHVDFSDEDAVLINDLQFS